MDPIVVVGSGAAGVHFALSLLQKGRRVVLLDVGRSRRDAPYPQASFVELKSQLDDPIEYFLESNFDAIVFPGDDEERHRFPPSKRYVFAGVPGWSLRSRGFTPLVSFASGGLAEAWSGGCYPFNDDDLREFPFDYATLAPFYEQVAQRIGVTGAADDLTRFFPLHGNLQEPLELDEHSQRLLDTYQRKQARLHARQCYVGRARTAVLRSDRDGRMACQKLGRCLWGCPTDSLYTPSQTLRECQRYEHFQYVDGVLARRFQFDGHHRIHRIEAENVADGEPRTFNVGTLVLAAGTISTARIFLESWHHQTGQLLELNGLMDNRQVLMPFLNPGLIGRKYDPQQYQFQQLAIGWQPPAGDYVHAPVTTLKSALVHPLVQRIPLSIRASLSVFRECHLGLGLVNVNLSDCRRPENRLRLEVADGDVSNLVVEYTVDKDDSSRCRGAVRMVRRLLRTLGCIAAPGMTTVRPAGASVHYAGTLPMTSSGDPLTTDEFCRSRDFRNLFIVDGSTFPFLPAKNITFTLMANAVRVAETQF